jgi:hypothetical protein
MRATTLALAVIFAAAPAVAETLQSGVWTYTYEPSSTGKGGLFTALSPSPSPPDDPNDPTYLVARCLGGRVELMVGGSGGWGMPRRQIQITTRIDDRPPETKPWDISTNGKAAFLDDGVQEFLKSLPDDGKLSISVLDAAGRTYQTIFRTTGFGPVRDKIGEACG